MSKSHKNWYQTNVKKLNLEKCYEILKFLYSRCLRSVLLLELNNAQSASE